MGIHLLLNNLISEKRITKLIKESGITENFYFHIGVNLLTSNLYSGENGSIFIIDIECVSFEDYINIIKENNQNTKFIALGNNMNTICLIKLLKNGFMGYIDIEYEYIDLIKAINHIKNEKHYITESQKENLLKFIALNKSCDLESSLQNIESQYIIKYEIKNKLNELEKLVFEKLLKGLSYKEIIKILGIKLSTLNQRTRIIYKKLNVKSRAEMASKYLK
jgi:two-component system nitrate/nitrite response regulator NarL